MRALRTPDERFAGLADYPFDSFFTQVPDGDGGTLRVHHVSDGPANGPVVLLLHGEPSWSYLYRKMIPVISEAGFRCVAPDLIGFGRSDKPGAIADYSYGRHVEWMTTWLESTELDDITLFCQDWGGLIGLRLVADRPERFARVAAANTGLPTGGSPASEAFLQWREFSQTVENFEIGRVVNGGCLSELSSDEVAAYDAPFPDESFKAGARAFPALVPISRDDPAAQANMTAWEVLNLWKKPFLTLFSDSDPITSGIDQVFQERIPGAAHQPHATIENAGHFLQEDQGPQVASHLVDWMS